MEKLNHDLGVPTVGRIVDYMQQGVDYRIDALSNRFRCKAWELSARLEQMVRDGVINFKDIGIYRYYYLPSEEERNENIVKGKYISEFKEMRPFRLDEFKTRCELSRNPKTGIV